jgi:hypothetical protein
LEYIPTIAGTIYSWVGHLARGADHRTEHKPKRKSPGAKSAILVFSEISRYLQGSSGIFKVFPEMPGPTHEKKCRWQNPFVVNGNWCQFKKCKAFALPGMPG